MNAMRKLAKRIKALASIAIVDQHGQLAFFERTDGAWQSSVDVAIKKARTALLWNASTTYTSRQFVPGGVAFMNDISNGGQVTFGGGFVLVRGSRLMGAIGVSGGSVPQDIELAETGKKAFEKNEDPVDQPTMSTDKARTAVESALLATFNGTCKDLNFKSKRCFMSVAVVDAGGHLMELNRMDGAGLGSVDVAFKKARTAAQWCTDTSSLHNLVSANGGLTSGGHIAIAGGVAIRDFDGRCLGAIGAAGGSPAADDFVASSGRRAVMSGMKPRNSLMIRTVGQRLKAGLTLVNAALVKADELHEPAAAAVVDPGGSIIAFSRLERAPLGSGDNALKKANAAVLFGLSTIALAKLSDPAKTHDYKRSMSLLDLTNGGALSGEGGEPIKDDQGKIVFGVGVSTATLESTAASVRAAANEQIQIPASNVIGETDASAIIDNALSFIEQSGRIRAPFTFCVVDQFSSIVKITRQTNAWRASTDLACKKAKTAVMFEMSTEELGNYTHPQRSKTQNDPGPLHGLEISNNFVSRGEMIAVNSFSAGVQLSGLVTVGGGLPLYKDGELIGGFGVAGSTPPEDAAVCAAGAVNLQPLPDAPETITTFTAVGGPVSESVAPLVNLPGETAIPIFVNGSLEVALRLQKPSGDITTLVGPFAATNASIPVTQQHGAASPIDDLTTQAPAVAFGLVTPQPGVTTDRDSSPGDVATVFAAVPNSSATVTPVAASDSILPQPVSESVPPRPCGAATLQRRR
eukprot:TRINITY_DN69820_c0_g1_i1.p1 TRINITY_DN69820_c0_g1~~TRINITY_DN69820_c0_g1_i1.p1  ORF type:complete len:821 (+),score=114.39 TRINITY_DN69820_c0_g1_i1:220-2463(+)